MLVEANLLVWLFLSVLIMFNVVIANSNLVWIFFNKNASYVLRETNKAPVFEVVTSADNWGTMKITDRKSVV